MILNINTIKHHYFRESIQYVYCHHLKVNAELKYEEDHILSRDH